MSTKAPPRGCDCGDHQTHACVAGGEFTHVATCAQGHRWYRLRESLAGKCGVTGCGQVEPLPAGATEPAPAHMLVANGTLTLAEAVARLYNAVTRPAPWPGPKATAADAEEWIKAAKNAHDCEENLDYINGRVMKIHIDRLRFGDPSVFLGYDRDNGEGRGAAALRGEV